MSTIDDKLKPRSVARILAVQVVYCSNFNLIKLSTTMKKILSESEYLLSYVIDYKSNVDIRWFFDICKTFERQADQIDVMISQFLKDNWKIDRLDYLTIAILRCAIIEIIYLKMKSNIVINEYVSISHIYGIDHKFINGILHAISTMHETNSN